MDILNKQVLRCKSCLEVWEKYEQLPICEHIPIKATRFRICLQSL